ncbi:MAG: T9SS type A sorting domain-containing protein [Bacteroidota bacterium]
MNKFMVLGFLMIFTFTESVRSGWQCRTTYSLPVAIARGDQWNVHLVEDGNNGAFMVWQDRRNGTTDKLYIQHIDTRGNPLWQLNGIQVCQTPGFQYYPQLISDGSGGVIITWEDNRTGSDYDIYAQRITSDGNLLWNASGAPVCVYTGDQYNPHIVSDGKGGAVIVWQDHRAADYDVYAQRLNSSGLTLWQINGLSVCSMVGDQLDPQLTPDGTGGAIFAWTDTRPSATSPDIYSQRIKGDGSRAWVLNGVPVCLFDKTQWKTQLISDGTSGAIFSWQDGRSGVGDQIFSQHLDSSGSLLWNNLGIQLSNAAGIQYNQRMIPDGQGGAVLVWLSNTKTGINYNLYGQRLNGKGVNQWSNPGIPICEAAGNQYNPQLSNNGSQLLVTWQDKRNGSYFQTYAQEVNFDGTIRWIKDGQLAYQSVADQVNPACVSDGDGGLIAAWSDFGDSTGTTNVFAQRIGMNGMLGGGCFRSFTQSGFSQTAVKLYNTHKVVITLPNAGNLRDSLFLRHKFPAGIIAGVVRKDSMRKYGWISFSTSNYIRQGLPQTGAPRAFDVINGKNFVGALSNPTLTRYNNQIVGELLALNLNVTASDNDMMPQGLGDLIFRDPVRANPLNNKSVRQIISFVDSGITMWQYKTIMDYNQIAVSLSNINAAFDGVIDTISTGPLKFAGVNSLFGTGFLSFPVASAPSFVPQLPLNVNRQNKSEKIKLVQNYPNPFNPTTIIKFELPDKAYVTLKVFNILGQEVKTLYNHELLDAGFNNTQLDGSRLSSGTYFYSITVEPENGRENAYSVVRKMLLIK